MAYTLIGSTTGVATGAATGGALNVALHDLLVGKVKYEGSRGSAEAVSEAGTNALTFDPTDRYSNTVGGGEPFTAVGYVLNAAADASYTPSLTITGGAPGFVEWVIYQFRSGSGVASVKDGSNPGTSNGSGTTSLLSGNITTTAAGVVVAFYSDFSGITPTAMQINGVAKDGSVTVGGGSTAWYRITTAGFTGQATGTIGAANVWNCSIIAFKESGGAAATSDSGRSTSMRHRSSNPALYNMKRSRSGRIYVPAQLAA